MSKPVERPLSGSELVLVAQVPEAGGRWTQTHFNKDVIRQFFRAHEGGKRTLAFERVEGDGTLDSQARRSLVKSSANLNPKIELDFGLKEGKRPEYPKVGRPIVVVLELDTRTFRYQTLMPGDQGHEKMLAMTEQLPSIGKGVPRVITNLDEVELRWPGCKLRSAH